MSEFYIGSKMKTIFGIQYWRKYSLMVTILVSLLVLQSFLIVWLVRGYYMPQSPENPFISVFRQFRAGLGLNVLKGHSWFGNGVLSSNEKHLSNDEAKETSVFDEFDKWDTNPDKMKRLNEHPLYKMYNIPTKIEKPFVHLLLIVASSPRRFENRRAIRETWWTSLKSSHELKIKALFMTDTKDLAADEVSRLDMERKEYADMECQPIHSDTNGGHKFLYYLVWAIQNYDFYYFMKMNDDYFLCSSRFLAELPTQPRMHFHWGVSHCTHNLVRPSDNIILLSRDLVEIFLSQKAKEMLCHQFSDQMIGLWAKSLNLHRIFRQDIRLRTMSTSSSEDNLLYESNICHTYIGIQGIEAQEQTIIWGNQGEMDILIQPLEYYSDVCGLPHSLEWQEIDEEWRHEPKLCIKYKYENWT